MTNEDKLREKWEARLKKYGLGVAQPMTDNSDGEMADAAPLNGADDFAKLRKRMDGSDPFMEGHQIVKVRTRQRQVLADWASDREKVQQILLLAFPKLHTDKQQRRRAARWARIIHLYFRMRQPRQIVARELGLSSEALKSTIRNINRVSRGLSVRGLTRKRPLTPGPVREVGSENETVNRASLHKSGKGRGRHVRATGQTV